MTTTPSIVVEAEGLVRSLATMLTRVRPGECLCCYVARQLDEYRCDGTHRHALRFRDQSAPRATALRERLRALGACCCDCELFVNGYELQPHLRTPALEIEEEDGIFLEIDEQEPAQLPPCEGVRRGSVTPCANWVRVRRR